MKPRFRDAMTWLHTWTGLLVGWILFAIFLTGTLSFFQDEISSWMQPELKNAATPVQAIAQAEQFLRQKAPDSERWSITLPNARTQTTDLIWRTAGQNGRRFERQSLDGTGQAVALRDSRGGSFLYRFHFDLYYMPVIWARWLVGICSMFMLLAMLTGVVIHKKIFKDFFSLQFFKGHKSWLDAHTITSVLALPFHLMITYTGLVTLMFLYMFYAVSVNFGDSGNLFDQISGQENKIVATGIKTPQVPLDNILRQAQQQLNGAEISFVSIHYPGDQAALVELREAATSALVSGFRVLQYSGTTGQLVQETTTAFSSEKVRRTLINLHSGRFADPVLRWLYFLSGVMGTVMVATGLLLWSARRKARLPAGNAAGLNLKLVDWLNAGAVMGLMLAVTFYFWANRLLPLQLADRAEWEIRCFFISWGLTFIYAAVRGAHSAWLDGFKLTAALLLSLPLLNYLTTDRHLMNSVLQSDWVMAGFDLTCFAFGLLSLLAVKHLKKRAHTKAQTAQNKHRLQEHAG
mgnify:FL=1